MAGAFTARRVDALIAGHGMPSTLARAGEATTIALYAKRYGSVEADTGNTAAQQEFKLQEHFQQQQAAFLHHTAKQQAAEQLAAYPPDLQGKFAPPPPPPPPPRPSRPTFSTPPRAPP